MPTRSEAEIRRERAELAADWRPGDSFWECPTCRIQVLVEQSSEFPATCKTCDAQFVSVPHDQLPAGVRAHRGH
jgi:hypothetical protein